MAITWRDIGILSDAADLDDYEEVERDEWGCAFPDECLMPSYNHRRSECYTVEMAEAWADEGGARLNCGAADAESEEK